MTRLLAPRFWGAHLLVVAAVIAAILLGRWQIGVWSAERAAEARDATDVPVRPLAEVIGPDDPFPGADLGTPVEVAGAWEEPTVFVSDRESGDRLGYWVVGMLRVEGTDSLLPVVRGWAPRPQAEPATGRAELTGYLQAGEGSGGVDADPSDDVVPELRIASLTGLVDADLYGAYVVDREPGAGLGTVTPDEVPRLSSVTALRNLLYGFQWWIFGGFAVFLWWRWCRERLAQEDAAQDAEEDGSGDAERHPVPSRP